jgi:hypothetical protein
MFHLHQPVSVSMLEAKERHCPLKVHVHDVWNPLGTHVLLFDSLVCPSPLLVSKVSTSGQYKKYTEFRSVLITLRLARR